MSTLSRLWRRAPVWRFFVYSSGIFLSLALIFPTPFVSHHTGWTRNLTRYLPSWGKNDQNRPAGGTNMSGSSTADTQKGDMTDPTRFIVPDITQAVTGSIPFGGHTLFLPAGVWHPVLSGQFGPNSMMSLTIFVRTDRGIVSGIMIASTTDQDVPRDAVEDALDRCHDDRNFNSTIFADRPDGRTECSYTTAIFPGPNMAVSTEPLIQLAFKRLATLGFPMPSIFIVTSWLNSNGINDSVKGTTSVALLLAPTQPGTVVLRAPLPYWDKRLITRAPAALDFVRHVDMWFANWIPVLRSGLQHDFTASLPDIARAKDPAAPE